MIKKKQNKAQDSEKVDKKVMRKEDRQLIWFFSIIVIVFVVFIGVYLFMQSLSHFNYGGVDFNKEQQGDLIFYHGRFPIIYNGELKAMYNVYFRNDPRENNISVLAPISFSKNITIAIQPEAGECGSAVMGQIELAKFLKAFPWVKTINSAVANRTVANELNLTYSSCEYASQDHTVIVIRKSNETYIDNGILETCYIIGVGDCKNIETVERFIMATMAQVNNATID